MASAVPGLDADPCPVDPHLVDPCPVDPCLALIRSRREPDRAAVLQQLSRYTGLAKVTPPERIEQAVAEELRDLLERARTQVRGLQPGGAAEACLGSALQAADPVFPQDVLRELAEGAGCGPVLARVLREWLGRYAALRERVGWLLAGTTPAELARLDPVRDCDRIYHALHSSFRVESRLLDLLSILRIAQSSSVSLFFRSTREAQDNPVFRFHDTMMLFANVFEWGLESKRGRAAVARINQIHGRYTVPDAGMKFVLLDSAFTWIEGADRVGHRPLAEIERRGYFHAYVKLGRAMNIGGLSDDYAGMYAWFTEFAEANTDPHPIKRDTFETIALNSLRDGGFPGLADFLVPAARVAMHDTFRQSVGYPEPAQREREAVRAVFFTLGGLVELLPPTAYIRSLQNNPARPRGSRPEELGVSERSPHLPVLAPDAANGGYPVGQPPVRTERDLPVVELPELSWDEIARHRTADSLWVVIEGEVFDVTGWAGLHPGGLQLLLDRAGQDATTAFRQAGHSATTEVFRLNYRIGRCAPAAMPPTPTEG